MCSIDLFTINFNKCLSNMAFKKDCGVFGVMHKKCLVYHLVCETVQCIHICKYIRTFVVLEHDVDKNLKTFVYGKNTLRQRFVDFVN